MVLDPGYQTLGVCTAVADRNRSAWVYNKNFHTSEEIFITTTVFSVNYKENICHYVK
jgi:hypothetical protein